MRRTQQRTRLPLKRGRTGDHEIARQRSLARVQEALNDEGHPLDSETRAWMEPRFGHDFSQVRIHTGERATTAARTVNALAYTVGNDVVFGRDRYAPQTREGQRLLAHELTHTLQQQHPQQPIHGMRVSQTGDAAEREARSVAEAVLHARPVRITAHSGYTIARESDDTLDAGTPQDASLPGGVATEPDPAQTPSDTTNEDPKTRAQRAVVDFRHASGQQAWPHLDRSTIADGLDQRIDTPSLINQNPLNVCGPASIVFMLASNRPDRFVDLVGQLFEKGFAWPGSETLTAGDDLRQNTPPEQMAQIDWMLLSSMRDAENSIFDFEGTPGEDVSAISTPGDLEHWMKSILQCSDVDWESCYLYGEMDAIHLASSAAGDKKHVVALLIDAALLENQPREGKIGYPNHWVVLTAPIVETIDASGAQLIKLSVWTWGQSPQLLTPDMDVFLKTFYGALIGTL